MEISRCHHALGESERALDYCGQALELEPSLVTAHHFAGLVLGRMGRWPEHGELNLILAKLLRREGRAQEALDRPGRIGSGRHGQRRTGPPAL